ncbi:Terminase small subunit [uncultured Caudovirales phage]|uniref:Terminase small subunit n=1 Tax=uncultured Caudovirales phage TaxID=2100421 RepID=A0A6J7WIE5_9CAUD|nr:Terminase small subunit [uncultured Caudovirales phage]CAB5216886.1 Terminase small subunit [uncultured Caudovirales phage]
MPKRAVDEFGNEIPTKRELAFAEFLASDPGMNRTKAAKLAGYSKRSAMQIGSKKLIKDEPVIKEFELKREEALKPIKEELKIDKDYFFNTLRDLIETIKDTTSEHFDPSALNQSLGLLGKSLGLMTDKVQLNAKVDSTHNIEMVKVIESDSHSLDALRLMMRRTPEAAPMVLDQ